MKKFILNLSVFLLMMFLFNIVVFIFANDNYYKGYNDFPDKKFRSFIIADSHGFALEKFSEKYGVYNFSSSSDSYLDMKRKMGYLVKNNYTIEKIYLTADGHMLSPYRDQYNNTDKSIIYTSEVNFNYINEKYLKYYFPIFQVKVIPLFKIYLESKLKSLFHQQNKVANIAWRNLSENQKMKNANERISGQFPVKAKSENLEKTLLEIIKLCKENNIELIGVKFPLSASYLKLIDGKDYGAEKVFKSKGLKVVDYESVFKNREEYFGDQDHLNPKGAEEFVKILLK